MRIRVGQKWKPRNLAVAPREVIELFHDDKRNFAAVQYRKATPNGEGGMYLSCSVEYFERWIKENQCSEHQRRSE
jgi:hypothetical protein